MGDEEQLGRPHWLLFDTADPTNSNASQLNHGYNVLIDQHTSLLFLNQAAGSTIDNDTISIDLAADYNALGSPTDRIYGSPHGSIASGLSDDDTLYSPASNVGGTILELPFPSPSHLLTVPEWDYKHPGADLRSLCSSMPPEAMYRDTQGWSPVSSPSPNNHPVFLDEDEVDFQGRPVQRRHSHSGYPSQGIPRPTPSNSSSPGLLVNDLHDLQLDDRNGSRTSSMIPPSSNSTQSEYHQVTLPIMFGSGKDTQGDFLTSYASPFPQSSFNPEPNILHAPVKPKHRANGALRRRGPDLNSIKNRTKNANPRPKLFCTFVGCNNLGFATPGTLKRHVNDKHSGKEHLCPMCSHMFADSTSVGRHERDVHGKATFRRKKQQLHE